MELPTQRRKQKLNLYDIKFFKEIVLDILKHSPQLNFKIFCHSKPIK